MINKTKNIFYVFLVGSVLVQPLSAFSSLFSVFKVNTDKKSSSEQPKSILPFYSAIETRRKELVLVNEQFDAFKRKADEEKKLLVDVVSKITLELSLSKDDAEKLEFKPELEKSEQVSKKVTLLNDRKQNLLANQDLFKSVEDTYQARINTLSDYIEYLQSKHKLVLKPLYSWQEFCDAQTAIAKLHNKVDETKTRKEALVKQELTEKETVLSLQKQIELKTKERDKAITDAKSTEKSEAAPGSLKLETDVFNEEINLLKEKVITLQLKLELLGLEIKLRDSEVEFISAQIASQKADLTVMEKRLDIELADVESARNEALLEKQKAATVKEDLNKKIEAKNFERSRLEIRKEKTIKNRKKIEARDRQDSVDFRVAKSEEQKIICAFENVVQAVKILQIKGERVDSEADEKDLLFKMVDLRYKLNRSKGDLEDSLAKFKSMRDLVLTGLRKLNLDRQEIMNALVNDTKELELLNLRKEEINGLKDTIFINNAVAFQLVQKNIELTEKSLHEHMKKCHSLLVDNSELVLSKEKIANKYNLIIQDIETLIIDQGIWKRSPNAISLEMLSLSLLECERFLARFFWDTPANLSPSALFNSAKFISFKIVFYLLLFALFYLVSFVLVKFLLVLLLRKVKQRLAGEHQHVGFLWLNIGIALLDFLVTNISLLFFLVFIYLHIAFKFKAIFGSIFFLANSYNLALFHLLSIPAFVLLSTKLLAVIKDLNKRLSFLFFAEKLEDRFILLITFFCYSTAVIIPFRQAFLSYPSEATLVFQNVVLSGYSLILAVIWLLFFSKDVMLRLVPFRGNVFDLLRYGIDQHYYPVFFFCMGLLILPLIGYSNLAWFLAFAIPSTVLLFYAILMIHYYIRKYALFLFMKEEDEEIVDKFEYAKTYYGLLVIFSFLFLLFSALSISAYLWRVGYTPAGIWTLLSDHWVIFVGDNHKFGVIQFLTLVLFVAGGFVVSSFVQRFILNKMFDILRTEPGMQNTVSKILHYATISFSVLLGLSFVHLHQLLLYVGATSAVAMGFVLRDVAADYISGLFILIERPLEIGNYVRLDQDEQRQGTIHKIDARTTTIINKLNHAIIVPNKDITNKVVSNWGKGRFAVGFEITINVDYHSDVALVRETIAEVVQSNPTILRVPRIVIRMENFNDTMLTFLTRVFISSRRVREQWDIAADLRENIFRAFREKGIEFAYPQRIFHLARDGYNGDADKDNKAQDPITFKF